MYDTKQNQRPLVIKKNEIKFQNQNKESIEISDRSLNSKMQFTNDYTNINGNGQNSVTSFNTIQAVS